VNKEEWQKVKQVLDDALALDASERPAFLDRALPKRASPNMRAEVDKLLNAYESGFLEDSAMPLAAEAWADSGLTTGQVIGRYKIAELVGTGGMGEVFRADDTELDRSVAFKVLHRDVADDEERVRRFIQEARAASALNHPNILTIHEIGTFEGSRYIVSEYVDGATLRDKMHDGLNVAESVEITCQIAAALQAAHSAGIVHRDIKPENVMIRKDGLVKVLDFGLAQLTEADDLPIDASAPLSRVHTSPGLVMGTVAYMSPEQAKGQPVDARTDLWSLGVVLHEMLTGSSPFEGESVTDLVSSIIKKDTPHAHLDTLPSELRPICQKALAKDKDSRYRSAHDLLKDLEGEKKRMEYAIQPTPYITASSTDDLKTQLVRRRPTLSAEYIVTSVKRHKYATLTAAIFVIAAAVGLSVFRYNGATPSDARSLGVFDADTTERDLKVAKFAGTGRVFDITISPDGRFIAYVTGEPAKNNIHEIGNGRIHVQELATQSDTELVPPAPEEKRGFFNRLTFAPDDSRLIYHYESPTESQVYSVPTSGGAPVKIGDQTWDAASISPDGKRIACIRDIPSDGKKWLGSDLVVADLDGSKERVLVHALDDGGFNNISPRAPAWSNDGKLIAYQMNFFENNREVIKLFAVNTNDGSSRPLSNERWDQILGTVWMPDGSLAIAGRDFASERSSPLQLWRVTATDAKQITNDPAGYRELSGTRDGATLVATQEITRRDLWVMNGNDALTARQITFSGELLGGFTPLADGSVVITSGISNNVDLWRMKLDGSGRKQLTSTQGINRLPEATRDGRYIVFDSDRDGDDLNVFRMDVDGGNVKQLTIKGGANIAVSSDSRWVYYHHVENKERFIYKVSIDGGSPTKVAKVDVRGFLYSISPRDGRIAEYCPSLNPMEMRIYSADGKQIKSIPLPTLARGPIRWTPDGRSVAYEDSRNGQANIWIVPGDGNGPAKPLTNFTTPASVHVKWSFDTKQTFVSREFTTNDAIIITRAKAPGYK
jgi:serine/threonine protein kinase/Tol biopolymer transport system component